MNKPEKKTTTGHILFSSVAKFHWEGSHSVYACFPVLGPCVGEQILRIGSFLWLVTPVKSCVFFAVAVLQLRVGSNVSLLLEHELLLYQMPAGALAPRT